MLMNKTCEDKWTHKGFVCWIEEDKEDDCTKNWHLYIAPGETKVKIMKISPYVREDAMKEWIDNQG